MDLLFKTHICVLVQTWMCFFKSEFVFVKHGFVFHKTQIRFFITRICLIKRRICFWITRICTCKTWISLLIYHKFTFWNTDLLFKTQICFYKTQIWLYKTQISKHGFTPKLVKCVFIKRKSVFYPKHEFVFCVLLFYWSVIRNLK